MSVNNNDFIIIKQFVTELLERWDTQIKKTIQDLAFEVRKTITDSNPEELKDYEKLEELYYQNVINNCTTEITLSEGENNLSCSNLLLKIMSSSNNIFIDHNKNNFYIKYSANNIEKKVYFNVVVKKNDIITNDELYNTIVIEEIENRLFKFSTSNKTILDFSPREKTEISPLHKKQDILKNKE